MKFDLTGVAHAVGAAASPPTGIIVSGWSIDSRTLQPGDLFFALRGPNHDGHRFVTDAFSRGAVAAIVEQPPKGLPGPALLVPDTLEALGRLAAWARSRWQGEVVAVTGSAGKTTTKDIIARLLATEMSTASTEGNLNNHFGLPLSILRLPETARAAVLEMGMNHAGEIRALARIARPSIGVVTNAGYAHAEHLGSIQQVALAKRELIEELPPKGLAVLNADDPLVARFAGVHPGPVITFGLTSEANIRAQAVEFTPECTRFRVGEIRFQTALPGRHGVLNVLAGLAVASHFGIDLRHLRDAVREFAPGKMRGERYVRRGITIFDDCYNSNPEAVRAMLDVLRAAPARRRFAVLGEMLELGRWSESLHRDVGRYVVECGIDVLVGIRGAATFAVEQALRSGLPDGAAYFFEEPSEAGEILGGMIREGDAVLFKGSRGTQVEKALERFLSSEGRTG